MIVNTIPLNIYNYFIQVAMVIISVMNSAQENVLRPVHVELAPGLAHVKSVSEICWYMY